MVMFQVIYIIKEKRESMNKRMIVILSTIALLVGASITEFQAQVSDV